MDLQKKSEAQLKGKHKKILEKHLFINSNWKKAVTIKEKVKTITIKTQTHTHTHTQNRVFTSFRDSSVKTHS